MRSRYWVKEFALLAQASVLGLTACNSGSENLALGALGATVLGTASVTSEIEQFYYVGVFDPQNQLPAQVYRIRVHGQASFIGLTKFASGWVPAAVVDSLSSTVGFAKNSGVSVTPASKETSAAIQTGRRLVMFGPEGFREAPANHRLAIVMGSDPSAFFSAIDESLGEYAKAVAGQRNDALVRSLFEELLKVQMENKLLTSAARDINADLPEASK